MPKVFNFGAGPAKLPEEVCKNILQLLQTYLNVTR